VRMPPSCHPSHLVHHPGEASIAASSQTVRILVLAAAASQKFRSSDHCGVQRSAARAAMSTGAPARVRRALMVWRGVQRGTWRAMHRMQLQVADHYESLTALSLFLFIIILHTNSAAQSDKLASQSHPLFDWRSGQNPADRRLSRRPRRWHLHQDGGASQLPAIVIASSWTTARAAAGTGASVLPLQRGRVPRVPLGAGCGWCGRLDRLCYLATGGRRVARRVRVIS
jgi:hypothetical protein